VLSTSRLRKLAVRRFAAEIETKLPKSEQWFRNLYAKHKHVKDLYNTPCRDKYIPDVLNKRLRYVIEVDGSVHGTERVAHNYVLKTAWYYNHRFKVFRVCAYDMESFNEMLQNLEAYKNSLKSS
jgi:hypothetical protein